MKKLISFVITLFCCVQAWAANPSFQSFYTNDFIVVQPLIYARHTNDGGTNVFNNTIIINTNTTIINTGDFITNTNTTIINNITTNITENSTIINTNVLISNTFITNIVDNSVIIITNTSVTIDGTNVATINPTIGRIPYKSGTNSFDDSALYFIDPSTVGADEVDAATVGVTNLVAGGIVVSVDSGFGYGYLTNMAFADTLLWTNVGGSGGSYQPTQPQGSLVARGIESYDHLTAIGSFITQLSAFELLVAGENDEDVSGKSYFAVVGADSIATNSWLRINSGNGVGQHLFIVNSADNSAFYMLNGDITWDNPSLYLALRGGDWVSTNKGDTIQLLGTFNGWAEVGRFWATTNSVVSELTINPTDNFIPYRLNSGAFADSPLYVTNNGAIYQQYGGSSYASIQTNGYVGVRRVYASIPSDASPTTFTTNSGALISYSGDIISHLASVGNVLYNNGSGFTMTNVTKATSGSPVQRSGQLTFFGSHWNGTTNNQPAMYLQLVPPVGTDTSDSALTIFGSTNSGTGGQLFRFTEAGGIGFGTGNTNVLYRSGTDLIYTNGSSTAKVTVINGSGATASIGLNAGGNAAIESSGSIYLTKNAVVNGAIIPSNIGTDITAGQFSVAGQSFLGVSSTNLYVQGFLSTSPSGASYGQFYHSGTNGNIIFDSKASGTAGSPVDFLFSHNGTTDAVVDDNLLYVQKDSIASVDPISVYGLKAVNGTSATSGQQQNSPAVSWSSQGWSTNLNTTESVTFGAHGSPVAGNAHPLGQLKFNYKIGISGDSGTQGTAFTVDTRGPVKIASVTKAQKTAILAPEDGMMVYQTDNTPGLRAYVNGAWVMVSTVADP